ncbi:MAG TPA: phosphatidylcholine synthase [Sphingomicrobium sp.]|nr:phosphatidylcholine synthase [Sphingomicrobium sp.]
MGEPESAQSPATGLQRLGAWSVHAFTASGAVLALLALLAVERGAFAEALLWLFAALVVDGIDGTFARAARVKERAPRIDGDVLDLVIDYLTYVFVPTLFLWRAGLVPMDLALPLAALIQLSSLYVFARRDMKTSDGYFRGFPALWNVIALYLYAISAAPWSGAIVVLVFAALSFAPVHVVHPFRVRDYGRWLPVIAIVWGIATLALLVPGLAEGARSALLLVSISASLVLIGLGLMRTMRGPVPGQRY